ncbi:MAG: ribonuclease D [Nitrospinaceae bacterium]|nr:ribonuclease D [Nitrospinaceae bacterium]NIR56749.1 ribonuclease D [Nitrospinaceae bacterium]NIS87198.1 ribonuclease D [Nitrospinaceae bacterium]NIT84067.1 ribonuclease D [Nitrospinaceae bacterium]NIU46250.1 ribonuclease D [Nitrospinaceae bacterium]
MYVTSRRDLDDLIPQLEKCHTLAIDTEFVREKTYFHRLGLIQVAGNGICAAVDPIAVKDLGPLLELLKQTDKVKVFHAGKQDLEILYRLSGEVVRPIFDTQVAASMVGWGAQISFAKIVKKVTGKRINKSETYTDWCRRPLSQRQIDYALDDVRYLVPVYEKLIKHLNKLNRLVWVEQELTDMADPANFQLPDPDRQYLKVKNFRTLHPKNLAVLRELAGWRETQARQRDCLPKSIIRDEPLLEIARSAPSSRKAMAEIRGVNSREISTNGDILLEIIRKGLNTPPDRYPEVPESSHYSTGRGVEELLAAFVQIRSEELKIEPHMLADRKMIHSFVVCHEKSDDLKKHPLFHGWRKELIGADLHLLLEGKRGLTINRDGKVSLISPPQS